MSGRGLLLALVTTCLLACGQRVYRVDPGIVEVTGVVRLAAVEGASRVVVIEDGVTGEIYALAGEQASDLLEGYGRTFLVRGVPGEDEEGLQAGGVDFPVLLVLEYTLLEDRGLLDAE